MFRQILKACWGGKVKFYTRKWNGYEIRLLHDREDLRSTIAPLVPYFWDSEVAFELGVKTPKKFGNPTDNWRFRWELKDLDGQLVKSGNAAKQGDGNILISSQGFRRKLVYWNSGKRRAVVLGNLHPHKEYMLYMKFANDFAESENYLMASLSVDDRSTWQMQMFMGMVLVLFTIFMMLFVRGCGVEV